MAYETIRHEIMGGVLTITLNRPETLNAFTTRMIMETDDALKRAGRDPAVRCIVLTGSGRAFSSGQDLNEVQNRGPEETIGDHLRQSYNQLIQRMIQLEKPIVGAINGVAAGAGCSVALATDLRIASDRASFIQVFSARGLIPDSGSTWILPRLIGYARAYEMAVTADRIKAEKALAWGLVNVVVPHEQLQETVAAWTGPLATGPTLAYGLTKRAMWRGFGQDLVASLAYEAYLQDVAGRSRDANEAISAFLEKRDARFEGR